MKKLWDTRKLKFYAWLALAFFLLGMLGNLSREPGEFWRRAIDDAWRTIFVALGNYVLFEYTLAGFTRKRIFKSLLLIIAHLFFYSVGLYIWRNIGIALSVYTPFGNTDPGAQVGVQMGFSIGSILFFAIVRHIYNYIRLKHTAQQLKIEKQQAELNYLKSQTNPHFLFNTLNNIYSLSRDKSDLAPESILRLSKMLRYMLYETGGPFIAMEQELKIIDDYIALEKLRYDDTLRITSSYDIEDMKQPIPPLILIPLVENAFKHGASETRNRPFVGIYLCVKNRYLIFRVDNSAEIGDTEKNVKENIGLTNLRRQLELQYADYTLSVQPQPGRFTAVLKINLDSHA